MKFTRFAAAAFAAITLLSACGNDGPSRPDVTDAGPANAGFDATAVETSAPSAGPTRYGEWSLDTTTGRWLHDSGTLAFEPSGSTGVLHDLVYGYAIDYNTGLVFDPVSGQWIDYYAQAGGTQGGTGGWSDNGAGWSYQTSGGYFGYGASDGTTTGFSFGNGCTVLDGSVMC